MTVASETNRSGPYMGNGVTTVFNYGFRIVNENHIRVIRANAAGVETTLVIDADYIVSDVGEAAGGQVALTVAPATGTTITILRNVPFVQETDLENQGAYFAETVEDALDLAAMRDQQLAEMLSRAVMLPASSEDPGGALAAQLAEDITRLAQSASEIDTVAGSITAVETVAGSISDVQTVAANIAAVVAASGSVLSLLDDAYVGDGVDTTFTLPGEAVAVQNVLVWVDGVRQVPVTDYTVSGTTLTFATAPGNGSPVEVLVISAVSMQDVEALKDAAAASAAAAEAAVGGVTRVFPLRFRDIPALTGNVTLTYVTGSVYSVLVGDILRTDDGFSYEVLASGDAGYDMVTSGGVRLRAVPGLGRVFDIRSFGARAVAGFDNGPAISAAITAAGTVNIATVFIPTGEWETSTAIDVGMGTGSGLSIIGNGPKSSIIKGVSGTFHGLMKITRTMKDQCLCIQGIGLLCDNAAAEVSERPHGLHYTSTIGLNPDATPMTDYGYGKRRNFIARDLFVGGYDRTSPFRGRLRNGIIVEFGRFPLVDNCSVDTGSPYEDLVAFPTTYINGKGIYFKDCYYGACLSPRVSGRWLHGIRFEGNMYRTGSVHADFEGAIVTGGEIVGWPELGISINHLARPEDDPAMSLKEPGFFISRTHIHAHLAGIRAYHHAVISILDCNIATTDGNVGAGGVRTNECHIDLHDVHSVIIDHCHFWGRGYDTSDTDCTRGIVINDKVNHVSINGCHFMHRGIGVLLGNADALDIHVGDGNVWYGRDASLVDVYQKVGPRIRVQKRAAGADVRIPRMLTDSDYYGGSHEFKFNKGPGHWTQSGTHAEISVNGAAGIAAGFTHSLRLSRSAFEDRWHEDNMPSGGTFKITAVIGNFNNIYPAAIGVQGRSLDGVTVVTDAKQVLAAGASGWQAVSAIVNLTGAEMIGGWRPIVQMSGIGGNTNAECYVAYFNVEVIPRDVETFLAVAGASPANTNEVVFDVVSNTSLRVRMRGTDGTVRSATLTLA